MPVKKLNFSISPINDNPAQFVGASFQNGFSHLRGQPTIKFSIPAQDLLLDTTALFLTGQFITQGSNNQPFNTNLAAKANFNNQNNAQITASTQTNYNQWNGVASCIDKVVLQSKKTNSELASVINYSQYDALKQGYSYNEDEYKQVPLMRNLAGGLNHGTICRHITNSITPAEASMTDQNSKFFGHFFSIPIDVALLQNQALHLGNDFVGGLVITLHLNNDSSVYFSRHRNLDTGAGGQPNGNLAGTNYTLKNLKLEGKYLVPSPQDLSSYNPNILLNSRENLINDIVSTENSNTYTPQIRMMKGLVNVYLDDNQTNNFTENQYNFRRPMGIIEYQQAKNNVRFPEDFVIKSIPNTESQTENASLSQGAFTTRAQNNDNAGLHLKHLGSVVSDVEQRLTFMKSLMGRKVAHHSATLDLSCRAYEDDYDSEVAPNATARGKNIAGDLMGVGADFTNGVGMVQNFVNQDYELRIKSGVNSGDASQPSSRRNRIEIQESFLRNFSQMNLKTLVKTI